MTDAREDQADPMIGRVLGSRYRVEALLGKGAMGAVYRARHIKVGRPFAVKVLHEQLLSEPKLRKRFEREAELAGKLHHINVIGVVDIGETEDGIHFMVMEFAEGPTLGTLVDGPMEAKRAINLAQQLCDGLQHAHEHGLIHRDFKPDNVIVEKDRFGNERPRIVDFGIAILLDDAGDPQKQDRLTTAGLVLGTPHYMAPEHAMGGGIDHRIDLFALGVIMYELLTGWLPFDGDGVDVARANLISATPAMGVRVPGIIVDPLLEAFTRLLMQKKPADRPESAKAARHLLDLIEHDRPMAARILGVTLPPEPVPAPAPPAPSEPIAMHRPISDDTPLPYRPTLASTPTTRADTVPERGTQARVPHEVPASIAMDALAAPRRPWGLIAGVGAGLVIILLVLVIVLRPPARTEGGAQAPRDALALDVAEVPASDAMFEPEGSATSSVEPPPAGSGTTASPPVAGSAAPTGTGTKPAGGTRRTGTKPTGTPTGAGSASTKPTGGAGTKPSGGAGSASTTQAGSASTTPPAGSAGTKPTGTKPTTGTTPAPALNTSANAVALLYGVVGRELKELDTKLGSDATQALWNRFRTIRIQDALSTPDKRIAVERVLSQLRRDIAAAGR